MIAVGGIGSGRACDVSCSAKAMATATAAVWALISLPVTGATSAEFDSFALSEDEVSAMKLVSAAIIHHNKMIAAKTSPIPSAVIWSAIDILLIQEYSHVYAAVQVCTYREVPTMRR
jgi:hypothetical protein